MCQSDVRTETVSGTGRPAMLPPSQAGSQNEPEGLVGSVLHILVDADACPTKREILRVAERYGLHVTFVAAARQRVPEDERVSLVVVGQGVDLADDWIADRAAEGDIAITADIPLAARCVAKGAAVLSPAGKVFDTRNVSSALATRNLLTDLRGMGEITGGPPPFSDRDRSRFLQQLDRLVHASRRQRRKQPVQ